MAFWTLHCVSCQATYQPEEVHYTCPRCGPLLGTLEVVYDLETVASHFDRQQLRLDARANHWRYLPLLPIEKPEFISPLAVGWTPLYRQEALAREWGLADLWVKDDGRNPTASLKDRASSVGLVKALEQGATTVTAASTGNAASSWAAFTALAGLRTVIFVPRNAPRAKIAQLLLYGAEVLQVEGNYDQAFDLCMQAARQWHWYNRSTAINPYLGEGKKTAALEICEQLNWEVPDVVFVSVGDGCIIQGLWKGFRDLFQLGFIERLPQLVGVQAEGAAPLVQAWREGKDQCRPLEPHTLADSIAVGIPRDQVKALRAVRESGGRFMAVSDQEILDAIALLARKAGVLAEPAGATALAGLKRLVEEKQLTKDVRAVVLVTGHGLKDIDGVLKAATATPRTVEPSLEAVARTLKLD
ncbi:MAG: threonine synthase [Calditrichaeota bacterium]|nr:MAG: threonine synthase [Calditrichota bacterium]